MALKKRKSKLTELFPEREAIRIKPISKTKHNENDKQKSSKEKAKMGFRF